MNNYKNLNKVTDLKPEDFGTPIILIKDSVEAKIRFLCNKIHDIEWSGVLFYTFEGGLENSNLKIICEDILLMDIGSSAFTTYKEDADIIAYQTEHDLLDCKTGLIHSHNNMAAFFSGTDTETLYQEGSNMPHFVSLIVNNAGKYVAKITRDVEVHSLITSKDHYTIKDFDGEEHSFDEEDSSEEDSREIQAVSLEIQFESSNESIAELDARISEIRSAKPSYQYQYGHYQGGTGMGFQGTRRVEPEDTNDYGEDWQRYFDTFEEVEEKKEEKPKVVALSDTEKKEAYEDTKIPSELVDSLVFQLITGSVITASGNSVDMRAWAKNMPKLFDKRFVTFATFKDFAGGFLDHLIFNTEIKVEGLSQDDAFAALAYHIKKRLQTLPSNRYLEEYIRELERYIV